MEDGFVVFVEDVEAFARREVPQAHLGVAWPANKQGPLVLKAQD